MDPETASERLTAAGMDPANAQRLKNDLGFQIRCRGGVVNLFDTGTVQVQGEDRAAIEAALGSDHQKGRPPRRASAPRERAAPESREVFVVYGHDSDSRTQLEAMLRRWDLRPLILDQLASEGATLIEKLERYTDSSVRFGIVLATPDDEGFARGKPDEKRYRARQNVVLELGLLLAKLGRRRVVILLRDQEDMERPSDLQGLIYHAFRDDVDEVKVTLAKEINASGIPIDLEDL